MWCFGTDQILVRQRYELRGGSLEITDNGAAVKKGYKLFYT